MTELATHSGFTSESFSAFLETRNEPSWVSDLRKKAWESYESLEMPHRRLEEWRRTDLRPLRLNRYGFALEKTAEVQPEEALLSLGVELGGQVGSVDSFPQSSFLEEKYQEQGVLFGSLSEILNTHGDLLKPYFLQLVNTDYDKFSALHAAGWSGGAVLYVPKGVKVDLPLHMWSAISAGGVDFSHTLVILESGAEATLMAETLGRGNDPGLHCGGVELFVGEKAKLRYVNLQNWGMGTFHFAHQKARVEKKAQLQWTIGALGARLAKVNQHVELTGEESQAQVNGVMFTEDKQHLAYHTLQHHRAENAISDLLYKSALQDKSHLVWRGMIKVDSVAQKTNGYQRNDNLMLSNHARTDSIPGLEIEADDVICTHGATTGKVEEEQIVYAQSRGLTKKEATRMIVAGFFQQIFDRITIESVKEALAEAIGRRIREYV
ncbi:Iron-regulated ABC transporter permease protein SufD [Planctomycetales bacterium 10988]|nr:Iron-regulated ABC transporter permease protein SufD [Planctomycetales bacterium 10988]